MTKYCVSIPSKQLNSTARFFLGPAGHVGASPTQRFFVGVSASAGRRRMAERHADRWWWRWWWWEAGGLHLPIQKVKNPDDGVTAGLPRPKTAGSPVNSFCASAQPLSFWCPIRAAASQAVNVLCASGRAWRCATAARRIWGGLSASTLAGCHLYVSVGARTPGWVAQTLTLH